MLSDKEKKEFNDKINQLKVDQSGLRKSLRIEEKEERKTDAGQYRQLALVYEFMTMILLMSVGGYFVAKYTNTMPWSMIAISLFGFIYAFYRLYKSLE